MTINLSETTLPSETHQPKILMFGLDCLFTATVLNFLIRSSVHVMALVVPGHPRTADLLLVDPGKRNLLMKSDPSVDSSAIHRAHNLNVPVYRAGQLGTDATIGSLIATEADILVCACYNRLIPKKLFESFRLSGINCHPSLLPELRGPDPVFWTFKKGDGLAGVTIHRLSSQFDSGNILCQQPFEYPDGTTEAEFDKLSGRIAGNLLHKTISALLRGIQLEYPQDESQSTHAPRPSAGDYQLDRSTSARSAFNFVRGVESRGIPIGVHVDGSLRQIANVSEFTDMQREDMLEEPASGKEAIEFASGRLIAELV